MNPWPLRYRYSVLPTELTNQLVVFITAKIASILIYLSAVHIYDFHVITVSFSLLHGFILNQHNDQLPVSLLAQLVEVLDLNHVQAWMFFFSFLFLAYFLYPQFTYMIFIKSQSMYESTEKHPPPPSSRDGKTEINVWNHYTRLPFSYTRFSVFLF